MVSLISEEEAINFESDWEFIMFVQELFNDNNHWLLMQKPNDVDSCKSYIRKMSHDYKLLRLSF